MTSYHDIYWQEALPIWRKTLGMGGVALVFLAQLFLVIPAHLEFKALTQPEAHVHHEQVHSRCDCHSRPTRKEIVNKQNLI